MAKKKIAEVADKRSQMLTEFKYMLPKGAREDRFARSFLPGQMTLLRSTYHLSNDQIQRLTGALRAIAYYTQSAPALIEVRKPLDALMKSASKTAQGLEALLLPPAHEDARIEARDRIRDAVFALHPERCKPDPANASFFHRHDECMAEAERMLARLREVESVAKRALGGIPASATKALAHPYPIACIDAALEAGKNGAVVSPSVSSTSPFREIVCICYEAAGAVTTNPETAIRAYMKNLKASEKSS